MKLIRYASKAQANNNARTLRDSLNPCTVRSIACCSCLRMLITRGMTQNNMKQAAIHVSLQYFRLPVPQHLIPVSHSFNTPVTKPVHHPYLSVQAGQTMIKTPENRQEPVITQQRELLTDRLTVPMYKAARRLAPLIDLRSVLEMLLIDEIEQLAFCKSLYVLDANGAQITGSIGRDGVDHTHYTLSRADHDYMQNIIGISDFRLSEVYTGTICRQPAVTAIQVIRNRNMHRVGFLGAEFPLRELPITGSMRTEVSQHHQLRDSSRILTRRTGQ